MRALRRFEDRLEQAVSGAFARVFRSAVQPVEIAAALQREADNSSQILSRDRRLAPNAFAVELSTADHDRLSGYGATLGEELATMLREHAEQQRYVFSGPVTIDFERNDELATGRFRVRSHAVARVTTPEDPPATASHHRNQTREPEPKRPDPAPAVRLYIEVNGTRYPLGAGSLVVGRSSSVDLRINDPGVSRRHAEVLLTGNAPEQRVSLVDLGSTNGTRVNGRTAERADLHPGDTVQVGATVLRLCSDDEQDEDGESV